MKNQKRFKELLLEIKGERSIRSWAKDTGVSASTLSNYINDSVRGTVTPQTLRKLVEPKSHPRGNVELGELYAAGGFEGLRSPKDDIDYFLSKFEVHDDSDLDEYEKDEKREEKNLRLMRMLVESEVALSNGRYKVVEDETYKDSLDYITLEVDNGTRIKKYIIVFDTFKLPFVQMGLSASKLGRLLYINFEEDMKVSLFTNDKLFFNQMAYGETKLSYRFDCSLVLFDEINISASDDYYVSLENKKDAFNLFSD